MPDFRYRINNGAWTVIEGATLPYNIAAVLASDEVDVQAIGSNVQIDPVVSGATIAYFDDAIFNIPVYNTATGPANVYKASVNKSFMVTTRQNAAVSATRRELCVQVYDEATNVAAEPVFVFTDASNVTGQLDTHGMGALCIDQHGNIHLFGGGHGQNMKHSVSTDDGLTWRADPALSGEFTYAKPVMVGNVMYIFMREDVDASRKNLRYYKSTAIALDGTITWSSKFNLIDMGSDSRAYSGDVVVKGTDIYISMTRANFSDTVRRGIYCFVMQTAASDAVRNLANTVSTTTFPVTDMTSHLLFAQTVTEGTNPAAIIGPNGNYHVLFINVADRVTTTRGSLLHYEYNTTTGALVQSSTVATATYSTRFNLQFSATGLEAMWTDTTAVLYAGTTAYDRGGDVLFSTRTDGGTWSAPVTIQQADRFHALFGPCRVLGAPVTSKLRWMYYDSADSDTNFAGSDLGNCRAYGYGPLGKVAPVYSEDPDATAYINAAIAFGASTPTLTQRQVYHSVARQMRRIGAKAVCDMLFITGAHDEIAARTDFYRLTLATLVGSYTWEGFANGFVPDGTTFKFRTGYNPSTLPGAKLTANSGWTALSMIGNTTGNFAMAEDAALIGDVRLSLNPRNSSNNTSSRLNDVTSLLSSGASSATGMTSAIRVTSAGKRAGRSGNYGATDSATSVGVPQNEITLYGGGTQFDNRKIMVAFVGGAPSSTDSHGLLMASALRRIGYDAGTSVL